MEIMIGIIIGLITTNILTIVLYFNQKKKKPTEYGNLELLSDLINNNKTIIEIKRIAPGKIFLRSPRDL